MASNNSKTPPSLSKCKTYEDWLKLIKIWCRFTDLPKNRQGSALVLSLENEALDAVLELDDEDIGKDNGVDVIIDRLNKLFKKDSTITKYQTLEAFETFKRPSTMSIQAFLNEFDKRLFKTKSFGTEMSDDILAYRLLKAANLSNHHEELIKATIPDLKYDLMKDQLKKTFSDASRQIPTKVEDVIVKTEETYLTEEMNQISFQENHGQTEQEYYPFRDSPSFQTHEHDQEAYYTRGNYRNYQHPNNRQYQTNQHSRQYQLTNRSRQLPPFNKQQIKRGKNPCDRNGIQLRCNVCESIYHMAQNCPEKRDIYHTQEIILFQSDYDHPDKLKNLSSETWNTALLDSGATNTVAGKEWYNCYIASLNDEAKKSIRHHKGINIYRFGDGKLFTALENVDIPIVLGSKSVTLNTDIVNSDIPLLLSKKSMKNADMTLDFKNDNAIVFGEPIKLISTESGHYAIPITSNNTLLHNIHTGTNSHFTLIATENSKSKHDIALKLHRQFAHPPSDRIIKLLNSAGEEWKNDDELKKLVRKVSDECKTCQIYKKTPSRPIVGLPMATKFQECVAMDLKFYKNKIILHLIDHATRLSASMFVKSKEPKEIVSALFKIWIQIYGAPTKFMSDNGGEFANDDFKDMCEAMNIYVKVTAAESPFSNGLVERHNMIIGNMLDKVLEDQQLDLDIALAWCINAKNSLANVHGFSPFQLVFGQNPNLPSTFSDKPPAHTPADTSNILVNNLSALHKARQAFIASENAEKIRRALSNNVRTSGDTKYVTGDKVYYKRINDRRWKGPGCVLGQDGQQVLVKHGSHYVRVHPCRLSLERSVVTAATTDEQLTDPTTKEQNNQHNQQQQTDTQEQQYENLDSDSDEENHIDSINPTDQNPYLNQNEDHTSTLSSTFLDKNQHQMQELSTSLERLSVDDNFENSNDKVKLKKGMKVQFKFNDSEQISSATILSRSGKATGMYKNAWNSQLNDGTIKSVDYDREVTSLELINKDNNVEEVYCSSIYLTELEKQVCEAKSKELNNWKQQNVYKEEKDAGQQCISVRWVITRKIVNGENITKARLCARGFEEIQDFPKDSPCCSRIGIRTLFTLIASNEWKIKSIDVKTAFLQGKEIERVIYLRPPKEVDTNNVWKLLKCVYRLGDASRYWYLRVREELINLGAHISSVDPGLFYWKQNSNLIGMLACHVDDMIWGGNQYFKENIIDSLKKTFKFGPEEVDTFTYIGIELKQDQNCNIIVNQDTYINSIQEISLPVDRMKDRKSPLTASENTLYRSAVGQLNWIAGISRPDISFSVCESSTKFANPTIADIHHVNKIIRNVKNSKSIIKFPKLDLKTTKIQLFTDASFNNLPNGGSQAGQIIFLTDSYNNCCPIYWNSSKIKRVVRSTIAAETLSLSDGCDVAIYANKLISEIVSPDGKMLEILAYTDNQSLYDAAHSMKQTLEKRLLVDISSIREMIERNEIKVTWIGKEKQLSDILTKAGVSSKGLLNILSNSKMIDL